MPRCVLETMAAIMTNRQPAGIRTKRRISVHLQERTRSTVIRELDRVVLQEIISITYAWNRDHGYPCSVA